MKNKDTVRERFEKEFTYKTTPVGAKNNLKYFRSEATPNRVWSFIQQIRKEDRKKLIKKLEKMKLNEYLYLNDYWKEQAQKLKNMSQSETYNQAIQDVIDLLVEREEK